MLYLTFDKNGGSGGDEFVQIGSITATPSRPRLRRGSGCRESLRLLPSAAWRWRPAGGAAVKRKTVRRAMRVRQGMCPPDFFMPVFLLFRRARPIL